jgi:PAS domain S-box-containing protein
MPARFDVPMDTAAANELRVVGASEGPMCVATVSQKAISDSSAERVGVRSQLCLTILPKLGKPYMMGLDQFTHARNWTQPERKLSEAIGQRIATLLTSLSLSRDLQDNKAKLEEAQRVAHVGYWDWNLETGEVIWSDEAYRIFGFKPQERPMDIATVSGLVHPDDREALYSQVETELAAGVHPVHLHRIVRPSGEVRTVHSITSKLWSALPGAAENGKSGKPHRLFGTVQDITELKHAESALEQSNARLEEAQRVAQIGHYEFNPIENQVTWSAELCRIWGIPPAKGQIDLAVVFEMIHPEDREYAARVIEETIHSGSHLEAEHRIVRPNGEVRFLQVLGTAKRDASGRAYELFGTCQDITDRKCVEQERETLSNALQQSNARLEKAQRVAHVGYWEWDLATNNLICSDEFYRIHGLAPTKSVELVTLTERIHPEDRETVLGIADEAIRSGAHADCEHRLLLPNGEIRFVHSLADLKKDSSGRPYQMFGTTQDITERKRAEQALRQSQFYLNEAQSLTHTGSWACNLVTKGIFHSSDENARLYGFDPSQGPIPFERYYERILAEDEPALRRILENAISTGTDYDVEFRIRRADGAIRFLRALGHHKPSQEIGDFVGTTIDITDRKHAEAERERLRQLEADLAHINRVNMMGELATALAHEIQQPLAASITSANALQRWLAHDPPDLERARATADRIAQDSNRAADIITSLRSFYKAGTPTDRKIIDVKDVINEMTVLLGNEAARHSITISAKLMPATAAVRADRVQLQQVLMNLMLNAIDAMKGAGGELTIRSGVDSEGHVVVAVEDTGVGLPSEGAELIFDPFHTTKRHGTGMGLTITRSIVESYGGRVWASANDGLGATFRFTLPVSAEGSG